MTTIEAQHEGSVTSGEVELFYRSVGGAGAAPLLVLHGANYYDSRDWVGVAAELGTDRRVVSYDQRGYGLSSWSPSRDYSLDAQLGDIATLLEHLGWERAVLVGHSRGGSLALRFAHEHPELAAALVLVDFSPGQTPGRPQLEPLRTGPWGPVYESLAQAHRATSRDPGELETDAGRARAEAIFAPRDGGWVNIRRDPAFQNDRPTDRPGWVSSYGPLDLWDALAGLLRGGVPALAVRATASGSYDGMALTRLRTDFAPVRIVEIDSGHDVPGAAPAELVSAIRGFLDEQAI
jgi:pimeloyl-ACP methyl ester carboxylesterase